MQNPILLFWLAVSLLACTTIRPSVEQGSASRTLPSLSKPVKLYYSGASGFYIEYDDQIILHDPYLTRFRTLAQYVAQPNDTSSIDTYLQRTQLSPDRAPHLILTGHTHYDHMYDIPYLFDRLSTDQGPYFYGNDTMYNIMRAKSDSFGERSKLIRHFDCIYKPGKNTCWDTIPNTRIRVLPIQSGHAPHICKHQFLEGAPKYDKLHRPSAWKTSDALAYLIEFWDENEIGRAHV